MSATEPLLNPTHAANKDSDESSSPPQSSSRTPKSKVGRSRRRAQVKAPRSSLKHSWYVDDVSQIDKEATLKKKHGRFMVHPDSKGGYELAINCRGEIWSVKIKIKGGGFCTCIDGKDGELFPSLEKLIKRHRGLDGRAIELEPEKQKGSHVTLCRFGNDKREFTANPTVTGCEPQESELKIKPWYFEGSLEEANLKMKEAKKKEDGTYLVCNNPDREGSYVMLVYYQGEIKKMEISRKPAKFVYVLGEGAKTHDTVRQLIKHHRGVTGKPIQLGDGNKVILFDYIKQPKGSVELTRIS